ncbi:MAG TPA: hypothetical protein PLL20_05385 [Phycisphaerae bacterium]|nr:hypothetical protein [Phycisphaerae bacterium]HRR83596.1 hypothetical protein [Phycisphaerae bacterium]
MKKDSQVTRRDLMEKAVAMGGMAAGVGASQAAQAAEDDQDRLAGDAAVNRKIEGMESDCPLVISGVIPRLGVSAGLNGPRSESGIGALMPWADRLWFVTYTAHTSTTGSGTGLFYVDEHMRVHKHPASVVGTYANRFVHAESEQMIVGPHVIDTDNKVRTIEALTDYRLTATMRHLKDPANKVYVLGMESHFFEVDIRTLKTELLFTLNKNLKLPDGFKPHYKGGFTAGDRVIVANNTYHERDETEGVSTGGRLAEWKGRGEWDIIESTAFNDVAGTPMGDHANAFATGWDRASVMLCVLNRGKWSRYRLPKGSHTHDQAWYTEWPRIREVETERFLMDMHGLFYELPRLAYGGQVHGVTPICRHMRIVPDFCSWRGLLVLAGNQVTACTGNAHLVGEPQSNLWFGKTDDLWGFGKPQGWGGPWRDTPIQPGQPSDPYLMTGFEHKCLHVAHRAAEPVDFVVEVDFLGNGTWAPYVQLRVDAAGYACHEFPAGFSAHWVRLRADRPCVATAQFVYT